MRILSILSLVACTASPVLAGPTILKRGEPDKQGVLLYTVTCETGGGTLVQCRRDERHCGYASEDPVEVVAEQACERIRQNRESPLPPPESP